MASLPHSKVRLAEVGDISALLPQFKYFQENSQFADCGFDERKMVGFFMNAIYGNSVLCLVAEDEGEIVGFMFATVSQFYFSEEVCAEDKAIFIRPDKRHLTSTILPAWLSIYEQWALSHNAKKIYVGCSSGTEGKKFISKMVERGYELVGQMTVRNV